MTREDTMQPTLGALVHYTLTDQDVAVIQAQRATFGTAANPARSGQTCPAQVVRMLGGGAVNLQVRPDGPDTYWAVSRTQGQPGERGHWYWPPTHTPAPLGWCPAESTGTELSRMLAAYPVPPLLRLYAKPGGGLPSWTGSLLSRVPPGTAVQLSVKDWPVDVAAWLSARPAGRREPVYLTLDHEPEQGPETGDPTPAQYQREWRELIAALAGHPRRGEVRLTPTFTEAAAKKSPSWAANFGVVAGYDGVDAVGFDVYDTGYPGYRTAVERWSLPLSVARQHGRPLVISEWGIARKATDPDGTACALAMREAMAYLRAQPELAGVCWFWRGDCALDNRVPERDALFDMIMG